MRPVSHGQAAFEAYNAARGGLTHDGKPIPGWSEVGDGIRAAWEAAARAVTERTAGLVNAALDVVEGVREVPTWIDSEAGVDIPRSDARRLLGEVNKWHRGCVSEPRDMSEVVEWIMLGESEATFDRLDVAHDTPSSPAVITDLSCMLVVSGAKRPHGRGEKRFVNAEFAARGIMKLVDGRPGIAVTLDVLERWVSAAAWTKDSAGDTCSRVAFGSAAFDAERVAVWLMRIARVAAPKLARVADNMMVVDGDGWSVAIMGLATPVTDTMPRLEFIEGAAGAL